MDSSVQTGFVFSLIEMFEQIVGPAEGTPDAPHLHTALRRRNFFADLTKYPNRSFITIATYILLRPHCVQHDRSLR